MINLFHGARRCLFPALMGAAVLLSVAMSSSARAEVYSPDGVPLSTAQWAEKSTDGKNVTVRDALSNSANTMITSGVKGLQGYTLTVLSFWADSPGGDQLDVEVRRNGSVQATCSVHSTKKGGSYDTNC